MNFSAPEILTQLQQLLLSQQTLMNNRTLINSLLNGDAPYTPEEQREENITTNVNFLDGTRICSNAVNQLNNTFEGTSNYFKVRIDKGPPRLRSFYSDMVTKAINRQLKKCRPYRAAGKSARAQVVLHGVGPKVWRDGKCPVPGTAGIEDVMIPNGTLTDMENLDRFGIYQELSWSQLERMAGGEKRDSGWNVPYLKEVLNNLYKTGYVPTYYGNRWMFPEKLQEDYKEGAARAFSASLPKALVWNYFFLNEDSGKWNRRVLLDYSNASNMGFKGKDASDMENDKHEPQLLYTKDDFAESWQEIAHFSIGNCSNVAPYRYHSIRSIGYLLFGVCQLQNKFRCRTFDHGFTNLLQLLRNVSEDNREKLGLIDLTNFGILPDGVSFVQSAERHVADWSLVSGIMQQNRQLMAESSSSFLPNDAFDSGKEMTATESMIRQNTSITLTSAVTAMLVEDAIDEYREICRRFCIKNNPDEMAVAFRDELKKYGVPTEVLDIECWEIMPEQGIGGGNKAAELTGTMALMQEAYPLLDPEGQREVLRMRISAITNNPTQSMMLVPPAPTVAGGDDEQQAQLAFSVLMLGVPFSDREGTDHVVMASVLLAMTDMTMKQAQAMLQQPSGVSGAVEKVAGSANVLKHVEGEIMKLAQSVEAQPNRKQLVKQLSQQWEALNSGLQQLAKAVMAAEQEQAQQQGGSPEQQKAMVKIQEMQATAETQRQIATANADQKREQKQLQWGEENSRRNADTQADIQRTNAKLIADLQSQLVKAQADAEVKKTQARMQSTGTK